MQTDIRNARVLIIDDEQAKVRLLEGILKSEGYGSIRAVMDPRHALPAYLTFQPDIILLDLRMPHLDGFAVMHQLAPRAQDTYLPILVITADLTPETRRRALAGGAKDFLTVPFAAVEVLQRLKNLLETRSLFLEVQGQRRHLAEEVERRTAELREAREEILKRLALAAEFRDDETGQHARRVGDVSARIAAGLSVGDTVVELIGRAAPLHDIGKIGIPDSILRKPDRLTPEEFELIKEHTTIGAQLLAGSQVPVLQMAEVIALTHHEQWDGSGYAGIKGDAIPLVGRVVALADAFDAITHDRPYRAARPRAAAVAEIEQQRGRQFDPNIVDVFLQTRADLVPQ